ncbi:MAG: MBL fold metallo-hydrolase [Abditibacteriota bacterium]|nr:MBL fold metallo-hydrolase [Abditibacteriota bacterium]
MKILLLAAVLCAVSAAAWCGGLKNYTDLYFIGGGVHRYFSAGDATVVRLPGGKILGIDFNKYDKTIDFYTDEHGSRITAAEYLLEQYKALGIDRLDYIVISHWHGDHAGGLIYLMEQGFDLSGATVFVPDAAVMEKLYTSNEDAYNDPKNHHAPCIKMLEERDCRIISPGDGDKVYLSGASLTFWNNDQEYLGFDTNYNNYSLVCCLEYAGQKVLFTGDCDAEAQKHIAPDMSRVQVLKSMHHSWVPVDDDFIARTDPDIVISMDGNAHDKYLYEPKSEIQPWAEEHRVPHYRTNINGTIGVRLSRKGVSLLTDSKPFVR